MKTTPHLFSRTYSGDGYTDTLFKLFGSREDAIVAMEMQIKADGWKPEQLNSPPFKADKSYISEDECSIPRYQVFDVPNWPWLIISYYQPNEVSIYEGRNTFEGAVKSLEDIKDRTEWAEEDDITVCFVAIEGTGVTDENGKTDNVQVAGDTEQSIYEHFEIIFNPFATKEFTEVITTYCRKCDKDVSYTDSFPFCPDCMECQH